MMLSNEVIFFAGFAVFVVVVMLIDLGVFNRRESHIVSFKEAGIWSAVWVSLAIVFYFFLRKYGYLMHNISDLESLQTIKKSVL